MSQYLDQNLLILDFCVTVAYIYKFTWGLLLKRRHKLGCKYILPWHKCWGIDVEIWQLWWNITCGLGVLLIPGIWGETLPVFGHGVFMICFCFISQIHFKIILIATLSTAWISFIRDVTSVRPCAFGWTFYHVNSYTNLFVSEITTTGHAYTLIFFISVNFVI